MAFLPKNCVLVSIKRMLFCNIIAMRKGYLDIVLSGFFMLFEILIVGCLFEANCRNY